MKWAISLKSIFCALLTFFFTGTSSVHTFPSVWEEINRWAERRKEENKASQQYSMCFPVSVPSLSFIDCFNLNWKFPGRQITDARTSVFFLQIVSIHLCTPESCLLCSFPNPDIPDQIKHRSTQSGRWKDLFSDTDCFVNNLTGVVGGFTLFD